jgi:hypothetical protein
MTRTAAPPSETWYPLPVRRKRYVSDQFDRGALWRGVRKIKEDVVGEERDEVGCINEMRRGKESGREGSQ